MWTTNESHYVIYNILVATFKKGKETGETNFKLYSI